MGCQVYIRIRVYRIGARVLGGLRVDLVIVLLLLVESRVRVFRSLQGPVSRADVVLDGPDSVAADMIAPSIVGSTLPVGPCGQPGPLTAQVCLGSVGLNRVEYLLLGLDGEGPGDEVVEVGGRGGIRLRTGLARSLVRLS